MIVTVGNTDVKIGKKALSGVKTKKNKTLNKKEIKKEKSKVKVKQEKPDLNDPRLKKMRENRQAANKMRNERWSQIITEVSTRSDLSDLHKQMLEKCLDPRFLAYVPRKMKKKFVNFMIVSGEFEAKYKGEAEKLFSILKTAEGSVPLSVRRRESRVKKALKKKLHKQAKKAEEEGKKEIKEEKGEKMDEDADEGADVDMDATVKSESEDESVATGEPVLKVKGRSKKNRTNLEKVGVKAKHLQGKLNKNKKGKGMNNKKRRNK